MPSKPPGRGDGEYEWVRSLRSIEDARDSFLWAVQQVEPQVLADLRDGPFKFLKRSHCYKATDEPLSKSDPLRKSLREWASRWNLYQPWIVERARDTLVAWRLWEPHHAGTAWHITSGWVSTTPPPATDQVFVFEDSGWNPLRERRTKASARITGRFLKRLSEYLDRIQRQMDVLASTGKFRRTPRSHRNTEHFLWLARRVVRRESFRSIAQPDPNLGQGKRNVGQVKMAVKRLAELIALPLNASPIAASGRRKSSRLPAREGLRSHRSKR